MTICSGRHSWNHAIPAFKALLISASLVLTPVSAIYAQDPADKANSLLDSLKKRSPEERWQRLKKQYAVDPSTPRRAGSSSGNDSQTKGLSENELPPSPEQSKLIPRLAVMPVDTSNDWLLPARDPAAVLEELGSEPLLASAEQSGGGGAAVPQPARTDGVVPSPAAQDDGMQKGPAGDVIVGESRPPSERKITDITPYYDRDRDSDIRDFAIVKGKEFGLQFKHRVYVDRQFPDVMMPWDPSNYYYHPLYFSDPALERYGHTYSPLVQPVVSIARFGTQFVMLPYQMTIDPPFAIQSPLGFYRPGDVTPKLLYQVPLNVEAAVVEARCHCGTVFPHNSLILPGISSIRMTRLIVPR